MALTAYPQETMITSVANRLTAEAIRQHIEGLFKTTTLEVYPFPHLIIENFFPQPVFERILAYNPYKKNVGEEWIKRKHTFASKTATPYYARKQINLHDHEASYLFNAEEQAFWDTLKAVFLDDDWFVNLVVAKYRPYFEIRFGELLEAPEFTDYFRRELFLQRHEPGYFIGPHTDIPTRVFTCIFSFADRPGFEEFGTELAVHEDPLTRCWGNNHYPPDQFKVAKLAPYKPNNFLLFFKTRQSFHSVKAIHDGVPNQRYGMQFQFYEKGQGVFNDLSMPDLLVTRHRDPKAKIKHLLKQLIPFS